MLATFWQWSEFVDYVVALGAFSGILACLGLLLNSNPIYVEVLGFASLMLESTLALPQLIKNQKSRSTKGMRYVEHGDKALLRRTNHTHTHTHTQSYN